MRSEEEIKRELEDAKQRLFYEEMADYLDWKEYRYLNKRIAELEQELKEIEEIRQ